MRVITPLISPLIEAWQEVKVQKVRVVLSLIGVVAAVAAMSYIMALGELQLQSFKENNERHAGRDKTLQIMVYQGTDEEYEVLPDGSLIDPKTGALIDPESQAAENSELYQDTESTLSARDTGKVHDPIGLAVEEVAQRLEIPYWTRSKTEGKNFKEFIKAQESGEYRGKPIQSLPDIDPNPNIQAVDPAYGTIFRSKLLTGRWLTDNDVEARVIPGVISENMWRLMGTPDITQPIILTSTDDVPVKFRVVGVLERQYEFETPTLYVPYESWQWMRPGGMTEPPEMTFWISPDQYKEARKVIPSTLKSILGKGWNVDVLEDNFASWVTEEMLTMQRITLVIGAIVIFLGALGLLNVAIVTVKQRMREIGIRRAMGASGRRIFFSVFMESVVATTVAGIIGVMLAVILVQVVPLETFQISLEEAPKFPVAAALYGVSISVGIGALCGIIPAFTAVRIKPIDAIRS